MNDEILTENENLKADESLNPADKPDITDTADTTETENTTESSDNENSDTVTFEDLGLNEITLKAVEKKGFVTPSPIQVLAIPRLLNGDTNLIARARTGTGKTAAFGLPIIQTITEKADHVQALILEPTRELAMQTCEEMKSFTSKDFPRTTVLYGGASYATQIRDLKKGCEIVVGTPGRIKDHLERKTLDLSKIKYFILDEGDEMLDMGFIDDIEEIFRQSNMEARILLFSATMPEPILKIAGDFMGEYDIIEEEKVVDEALLIDQKFWYLKESDKIEALVRLIDMSPDFYGLVFTMTKNDADRVSKELDFRGYEAAALHGDIMQNQREKVLERFRMKKTRILVATDVAARGIDISGLSHVVNYSLPFDTATYVHRIGRTGRAGTEGIAITFVRPEEKRKMNYFIKNVNRATKGELKEDKVPSVHDVLEIKEKRVIKELEEKLFEDKINSEFGMRNAELENGSAEKSKITDSAAINENDVKTDTADNANIEISSEVENIAETSEENPSDAENNTCVRTLRPYADKFKDLADNLCENQEPAEVIAGLLSIMYGEKLSPKHYGRISTRETGGAIRPDQMRIYVSLGKRDGYRAKEIADYFSELLHIPGRLIDDIDTAQQFTLLTLPKDSARKALEMSKNNRKLPHMHIDEKSEGRGSRKGGSSDSFRRNDRDGRDNRDGQKEGRSFEKRENREFRGDRRDRSRDFGDKRDFSRSRSAQGSRTNPHNQTQRSSSRKTNNASAFVKKSGKAERF